MHSFPLFHLIHILISTRHVLALTTPEESETTIAVVTSPQAAAREI
jgi:hypothetical protein